MSSGIFITFEGGEGGGKSTHARLLAERVCRLGRVAHLTREPGGTDSAERIREILVKGEPEALSSTAEALLNYAARDDHLRRLIRPALAAGEVVISDRFMDSTRAYQAYAGDCPPALLEALEREVVNETIPHRTLILDLPPEEGLRRAGRRLRELPLGKGGEEDRFERFGMAFHERLRAAFLRIARENPDRCVVVDATRPLREVAEDVWRAVAPLFGERELPNEPR